MCTTPYWLNLELGLSNPNPFFNGKISIPNWANLAKMLTDLVIFAGIKDNSESFFGLWPYDIPGEDWLYKCGGDWCTDPTLTITCSKFNTAGD